MFIIIDRNVLQESARIARGNITALSELNASQFNGLVVPGGFGAAKNLYEDFTGVFSKLQQKLKSKSIVDIHSLKPLVFSI